MKSCNVRGGGGGGITRQQRTKGQQKGQERFALWYEERSIAKSKHAIHMQA